MSKKSALRGNSCLRNSFSMISEQRIRIVPQIAEFNYIDKAEFKSEDDHEHVNVYNIRFFEPYQNSIHIK